MSGLITRPAGKGFGRRNFGASRFANTAHRPDSVVQRKLITSGLSLKAATRGNGATWLRFASGAIARKQREGKNCMDAMKTGFRETQAMNGIHMENKNGVDYSAQYGVICPNCGKMKVSAYHREPWLNGRKVRYHRCMCGWSGSSLQIDPTNTELTPTCPPSFS